MKVSALSNCSDIFTYLRRKKSEFGYMTVTDSHGMPFYHQDDALALAASQWNEVFEANKEHIPYKPISFCLGLRVMTKTIYYFCGHWALF